ncbi:dihydrofolate reductase [Rhodobacteraceae bacterium CCMM004]|nr:dihydrofolate reductase [Rhodobacteraceae bacterium CCMM004]
MLTLIAACARDGAIGRDGTIPWHAPEDLAFFQRETRGGAVIMGRRTWESLPERAQPLPGRLNLVVSRETGLAEHVFADVDAAVAHAEAVPHRRVYGAGGAGVYAALMNRADRLLLTEVEVDVPGADTFFPPVAWNQWRRAGGAVLRADGPRCVLTEWLRSAPPAVPGGG